MATTQTTILGGLTPEMQTFYDKSLLKRLLPELVHAQFGQKRPIPKAGGKTINFRKFSTLAAATVALTEGATPAGNSLTVTAITATVGQYGDFVEISDVLDLTAIDPILVETGRLLGEQSGLTLDTLVRDVINAGTTVQYANGKASRILTAAGDNLTVIEIRKAVRTLKRNKARKIDGNYVAIVEPGATYDLQSDPAWVDAQKYAGSKKIFSGEIGELYGVRFIETTEAKKFAGLGAAGIDIYSTLILGADAYGIIDVAGSGSVQNIVKPFGSAGTADPLNQRSTSGWKVVFTAKILEDLAILRIEHAMTA